MPPDPFADLTRLQEQEERAVETIEEHRRQIATLEALLEDARRRGEAPGVIEARIEAAEEEVARAGREIAALRGRIAAAEKALPTNFKDDDEEA